MIDGKIMCSHRCFLISFTPVKNEAVQQQCITFTMDIDMAWQNLLYAGNMLRQPDTAVQGSL